VLPTTQPSFNVSYPDGQGGWVTIGTIPPAKASPGAAPATAMSWAQLAAAALSALVAAATLYFMFHHKGAASS
jgi:hypothetical protein